MNGPVHGFVDADGRLMAADPPLAGLNARAGGSAEGPVAVPQLARLARLVQRLGVVVSRGIVAADGESDLDLWVRAAPEGDGVHLSIVDWTERPMPVGSPQLDRAREDDARRAAADWHWEADAALRLTGLSAGAPPTGGLLGQPLTRLLAFLPQDDGTLPIVEALAEQRAFDGQDAVLRGAARPAPRLRLAGVPIIDAAGGFAGFRGSATLLPARPDQDAATPEEAGFPDRLGHALKAPLDRIIAQAETIRLQSEGPIRRDYAGYAGDIAAAGRHLLGLVTDLLDLSTIEQADFRVETDAIDLADVARRAAGLLVLRAEAGGVPVTPPDDEATVPACGDFRRTLQILVNLIGNAIRYAPPGTPVLIAGEVVGTRARISVTDRGRGIAPEDQTRIFEKFERVDPSEAGTTGLGLYIAQRLAMAMGGRIEVESAVGEGARFTLDLPGEG